MLGDLELNFYSCIVGQIEYHTGATFSVSLISFIAPSLKIQGNSSLVEYM